MTCEKAQLEVLDENGNTTASIPVQFNPTTMSLQMSNSIDGSENQGRQTRTYNGTSSTELSLDLEFDTADLGTSDNPVDVRSRTLEVAQFVLPGGEQSKQAPPRVRFCWGSFELAGVMSTLSEELSFFSTDGVPLRAKISIKIKEQDPKYAALESGPGANPNSNPTAAGEKGKNDSAPGSSGDGEKDRAAETQDNESPADFLARNGLAPDAWRALGSSLDALSDGVGFEAGIPIAFPSTVSLGAGIGVSAGFQAGLGVSTESSLGLDIGEAAKSGGSGSVARQEQGFALSAAGGLTAASEMAKTAETTRASTAALASFGMSLTPVLPATDEDRSPLRTRDSARTLRSDAAAPAPLPPKADVRATTYGRGIPLRDRVRVPTAERGGYVVIGDPERTSDSPGPRRGAPWEVLPASAARTAADREQHRRSPSCGCHRCDPRGRQRYKS